MPDLTTIPDPALSCALAEVLRLEKQLQTALADNARLRRFATDQQRAAENCGHNLEAAEQDVETLREACERALKPLTGMAQCWQCDAEEREPCDPDCPAGILRAALAAIAPAGEGR